MNTNDIVSIFANSLTEAINSAVHTATQGLREQIAELQRSVDIIDRDSDAAFTKVSADIHNILGQLNKLDHETDMTVNNLANRLDAQEIKAMSHGDAARLAKSIELLRAFGAPVSYLAAVPQGGGRTFTSASYRQGVLAMGTELGGGSYNRIESNLFLGARVAVIADARGVRRQSYEGYTFTYEDIGNSGYEVHDDGEIWAAALWDVRKAVGQTVADYRDPAHLAAAHLPAGHLPWLHGPAVRSGARLAPRRQQTRLLRR